MIRTSLVGLVALVMACGEGTVCPLDLRVGVAPSDTTIAVGGTITPRVTLLGCAGTKVLSDSLTWSSADPTIAAVGTRSGVVIGTNPGATTITVTGKTYGHLGTLRVTVR